MGKFVRLLVGRPGFESNVESVEKTWKVGIYSFPIRDVLH